MKQSETSNETILNYVYIDRNETSGCDILYIE